ncbi:protein pxr1-like [Pitangus sulphuratus]|nr:protein pxr1-like [Pitangus sulphuratus]
MGKILHNFSQREESKYVREMTLQTPRSVKDEGEGDDPGIGVEILLQPMVKTIGRQAVPLQPLKVHGGVDIHLQPMDRAHAGAGGCLKKGCDPMGSPHCSRLLAGPMALWREEPMLEQVCWQDLWSCGGPTLEQSVPEGQQCVEGTHARAVHEELQPV